MKLCFDRGTLILADIADSSAIPPHFTFDNRVDQWRAPAYLYRAIIEHLVRQHIPYQDDARHYQELQRDSMLTFEPHPYQIEALHAWKTHKYRGIIELPTGAGKSYLGQMAIEFTKRSTLIVVPTIDLLHQWYSLLSSCFGNDVVGLIGGGYYEVQPLTMRSSS